MYENVQQLMDGFEKTRSEMNRMGAYMPLSSPELLQKSAELDQIHNQLEAAKIEEDRLREQPADQHEA